MPERIDWEDRANCRGIDMSKLNLAYGERPGQEEYIKTFCNGCPVKYDCLKNALDTDEDSGVWGGMAMRTINEITRDLARLEKPELSLDDAKAFGHEILRKLISLEFPPTPEQQVILMARVGGKFVGRPKIPRDVIGTMARHWAEVAPTEKTVPEVA